MLRHVCVAVVVALIGLVAVNGDCEPFHFELVKIKAMSIHSKMIELTTNAQIDLNHLPHLSFNFEPPLVLNVDYEIDFMKAENSLPPTHSLRRKHAHTNVLGLSLMPGKVWIKDLNSTKELFITDSVKCSREKDLKSYRPSSSTKTKVRVAIFSEKHGRCPTLPPLPDATPEFELFVKDVFSSCANVRVVKSRKLSNHRFTSLQFLSPNLLLLLVDASDQPLSDAALAVDTFLGPHSVLDVVWEPYSKEDPTWFFLVPRPRGMPGHLFAMIDSVQWEHPAVLNHKNHEKGQCVDANTKEAKPNCLLGCPDTFIHRVTASGYGADTWHLMLDTRRALAWHDPVQMAPLRMGQQKLGGPAWEGSTGWTYTYGGCPSNFVDCYFLSHTPCPAITVDPYEILGENRSRVKAWYLPEISKVDEATFNGLDKWWHQVLGSETPQPGTEILRASVENHHGRPAEQVFYSYMWRPNYGLRKEVQRRVKNFDLNEPCASMHVRRGDTVHHGGKTNTITVCSIC